MSFPTFTKDPAATLDYGVDWTAWLGTDTITTSRWAVPTGLINVSDSHTAKIAIVWLSGGTVGASYEVTNHIETAGGRVDERSILIQVAER